MKETISVIVPVFNGEKSIVKLTQRLNTVLENIAQLYEIILVNDGSKDSSWDKICDIADKEALVTGINLMHNYGQHNALLVGIQRAKYEIIITIDDDLQHPPEEITKLVDKINEGYDIVYGKPSERKHNLWRNISSKVLKSILKIVLGAEMGQKSSAFRAFRGILRRGFHNFSDAQLSIDVLLSWSAGHVACIPVEHNKRYAGRSGYTLTKLFRLAFSMLTGYSTLPLRIASAIGFITSLMGISMFFYVVIRRLIQTTYVPGFAFIASEIALFAGLQLFAIGVIGEYLARLHFRTMGKPPYVVRDIVGYTDNKK